MDLHDQDVVPRRPFYIEGTDFTRESSSLLRVVVAEVRLRDQDRTRLDAEDRFAYCERRLCDLRLEPDSVLREQWRSCRCNESRQREDDRPIHVLPRRSEEHTSELQSPC